MKGKVFGLALLLLIGMGTPYARAQRAEGEQSPSDSLNVDLFFRNLPEVMVKGERPIAKLERGRLTYDMPLLLQRIPSDNALEALGNIPGVSVQAEKVNFAGQPVTLIINGKATTMDYSQAVERLKSMPADRLAKAEVMLSAPARYHVRGAAINIVTKDYTGKHVSGQLKGTYTQDRYASGNLQGNLLYADGKLTLDAGYAYTNGHGYGEAEHKALHPLGDERIAYADRTTNKTHGLTHYYRTALDYKMAENEWLSLAYTGSWESHRSRNRTTGNSVSRQESQKHNYLHNVDFSYNLPFDLLLTASYTRYEAPKDQWLHGRPDEAERNLSAGSNQKIDKWWWLPTNSIV